MLEFSIKNFKHLQEQNAYLRERLKAEETKRETLMKENERLEAESSQKTQQMYKYQFRQMELESREALAKEESQKLKEQLSKCSCSHTVSQQVKIQQDLSQQFKDKPHQIIQAVPQFRDPSFGSCGLQTSTAPNFGIQTTCDTVQDNFGGPHFFQIDSTVNKATHANSTTIQEKKEETLSQNAQSRSPRDATKKNPIFQLGANPVIIKPQPVNQFQQNRQYSLRSGSLHLTSNGPQIQDKPLQQMAVGQANKNVNKLGVSSSFQNLALLKSALFAQQQTGTLSSVCLNNPNINQPQNSRKSSQVAINAKRQFDSVQEKNGISTSTFTVIQAKKSSQNSFVQPTSVDASLNTSSNQVNNQNNPSQSKPTMNRIKKAPSMSTHYNKENIISCTSFIPSPKSFQQNQVQQTLFEKRSLSRHPSEGGNCLNYSGQSSFMQNHMNSNIHLTDFRKGLSSQINFLHTDFQESQVTVKDANNITSDPSYQESRSTTPTTQQQIKGKPKSTRSPSSMSIDTQQLQQNTLLPFNKTQNTFTSAEVTNQFYSDVLSSALNTKDCETSRKQKDTSGNIVQDVEEFDSSSFEGFKVSGRSTLSKQQSDLTKQRKMRDAGSGTKQVKMNRVNGKNQMNIPTSSVNISKQIHRDLSNENLSQISKKAAEENNTNKVSKLQITSASLNPFEFKVQQKSQFTMESSQTYLKSTTSANFDEENYATLNEDLPIINCNYFSNKPGQLQDHLGPERTILDYEDTYKCQQQQQNETKSFESIDKSKQTTANALKSQEYKTFQGATDQQHKNNQLGATTAVNLLKSESMNQIVQATINPTATMRSGIPMSLPVKHNNINLNNPQLVNPTLSSQSSLIQLPHSHNNIDHKVKSMSSINNLNKEPGRMKQHLENNVSENTNNNLMKVNFFQNQVKPNSKNVSRCTTPQKKEDVVSPVQRGERLFEQFAIFGIDKAEIDPKAEGPQYLKPKTQLRFPKEQFLDDSREKVLPLFAFPQGVETKKLKMTDSLSQINEITFANYVVEYNENCFTFVVKTDDSFKRSRSKNSSNQLLDLCNPSRLLYGICFKINDIIEDDSKQTRDQQRVKTLADSHSFWVTKRALCFLTYFPFVKFFLDIISSFLNELKMERLNFYTSNQQDQKQCPNLLARIEQQYLTKLFENSCIGLLKELQNLSTPRLNSTVLLSYKQESFLYCVPDEKNARYIEAEGSSSIVLSCIPCEIFLEIFFNILVEQSVVFVSQNPALLSSVVLMFYSLLKPLKWPHPLISILPESLIHLLDSPIPIFVGLSMTKQEVISQGLSSQHEQCIFVFLDEPTIEVSTSTSELTQIILNSPLYQKLLAQTEKSYDNILPEYMKKNNSSSTTAVTDRKHSYKLSNTSSNLLAFSKSSQGSNGLVGSQSHGLASSQTTSSDLASSSHFTIMPFNNKKELLISPNEEQKKACRQLMIDVSQFIKSEIIDYLPQKNLVAKGDVVDFDLMEHQIISQKRSQDPLLVKILKTQMFSYFVEEHYFEDTKNL